MTYLVFDTETTGVDVHNDRIVQLFIMAMTDDGTVENTWEWIINPGVPIPEGASAVHGFTDEFVQQNGDDPYAALLEAYDVFEEYWNATWVAYNLNFDLSILDAEFARHDVYPRFGQGVALFVDMFDPLVVDRAKDKYRKGKRTLEAVAPHYGVQFDPEQAHKADYDVEITGKVALAMIGKYGVPSTVQQAGWYASWAKGLETYLQKSDPEAQVDSQWPYRSRLVTK